jgi:hypothetical protein
MLIDDWDLNAEEAPCVHDRQRLTSISVRMRSRGIER